jgi:hypothetical protein
MYKKLRLANLKEKNSENRKVAGRISKFILKSRIGRGYELDSSGLANVLVVGCCEYGNKVQWRTQEFFWGAGGGFNKFS